MLSCRPGDHSFANDFSGRGTIGNARNSGRVIRTIKLMMSRRTLLFVLAAGFLVATAVLHLSAGGRSSSMMLPPERPIPMSGSEATFPLSTKNSDLSQTKGHKDTGSTIKVQGTTEGGGTPWRALGARQKGLGVASSSAAKPTINMTPAEDQHPPSRVAIFVYEGIPELDHIELVQCYRDVHDGVAPWQDERTDMAENMGEIWMHR